MNTDEILKERGSRYGDFKDNAATSQNLKREMQNGKRFHELNCSQRESLEMIQHKIARIINGDPNYADSWVDIAGYAQLVADELEKK